VSGDFAQEKRKFLENEIMLLTLNAGLSTRDRHSKIYADGVDDDHKEKIRDAIRNKLSDLGHGYITKVSPEEEHIRNIVEFADELTSEFSRMLDKGRFRIGVSQKVINLYLKYLWTLGWLAEPPCHCPFDSIVIGTLDLSPRPNWTCLDSIDEYRSLVTSARKAASKAGLSSLAVWELGLYDERRRNQSASA